MQGLNFHSNVCAAMGHEEYMSGNLTINLVNRLYGGSLALQS